MSEEKKATKSSASVIFICVSVVILVGALLAAGYWYMQYQKSQQLLKNPTLATQMQAQELLMQVGKIIELPKDEQPTIATVSDVTKLQDQSFFVHAVNGDKVLIYTKAKKAILYDPIADKIIDVAPVNLGASSVTPAVTPSPSERMTKIKPTSTPSVIKTPSPTVEK